MKSLSQQPRQRGMQQAISHAESVEPQWCEQAIHILRWFLRRHKGKKFTSEQVVEWADAHGFRCPTDPRSWGSVMLTAKREGLIVKDGYGMSQQRCTPVVRWRGA